MLCCVIVRFSTSTKTKTKKRKCPFSHVTFPFSSLPFTPFFISITLPSQNSIPKFPLSNIYMAFKLQHKSLLCSRYSFLSLSLKLLFCIELTNLRQLEFLLCALELVTFSLFFVYMFLFFIFEFENSLFVC